MRKLIGNLLAATVAPILLQVGVLPNVFRAIFYGEYKYYDFKIDSLKEYLLTVYSGYFLFYFVTLVFVLLPFQLIKNHYNEQGIRLSFLKKSGILSGIVLFYFLIAGLFFVNLFFPVWYYNLHYLLIATVFGVVMSAILHLLVDSAIESRIGTTKYE